MILILGGIGSGRYDFLRTHGFPQTDCYTVTEKDAHAFAQECAAYKKRLSGRNGFPPQFSEVCARISSFRAVVATEMGLGIIPLDAHDRTAREENGRLNIALAFLSDCVVLMTAGIPRVIKGTLPDCAQADVQMLVFRHGATQANLEKRYAGGFTDIDLCDEGRKQVARTKERLTSYAKGFSPAVREQILFPRVVYVSPMRRAVQTAELLYPHAEKRVVQGFKEMDFGLFENRTVDDLFSDPATHDLYQAFVDSNATLPCPPSEQSPGESIADFLSRTADAFRTILREQTERIAASGQGKTRLITIVAHGGTQMSLFSQFCATPLAADSQTAGNNPYYEWQTDCAGMRWGRVRFS